MEKQNKTLLQLSVFIIILLTIGVAFWRRNYIEQSAASNFVSATAGHNLPRNAVSSSRDFPGLAALKDDELLGVDSLTTAEPRLPGKNGFLKRFRGKKSAANTLAGNTLQNASSVSANPSAGMDRPDYTLSYEAERAPSQQAALAAQRGYPVGKGVSGNHTFTPGVYRPSTEERASGIMAPYMKGIRKEQAAALAKQLDGLSSRVERAIYQAMLPKSKKDANIEKYLRRHGKQTASPLAGVAEQVAAQKEAVVSSMKEIYGASAAGDAGQIMDDYQKELAAVSNQPGKSLEELASATRAVNEKYNNKLQDLSKKEGLKQFEKDKISQDTALQQDLAKAYGANVAGQMGKTLQEYRQKELELAQENLSPAEYYKRQLELQRERRKALEKELLANNLSLDGLIDAEDRLEEEQLKAEQANEESGKTLPRRYVLPEDTKKEFRAGIQKDQTEKVQLATQIYGKQGAALMDELYARYAAKAEAIMNDPETSRSQKMKALMAARQETNQAIMDIQKRPEMVKLRVESTLDNLLQDPGLSKATEEQKEAFKETARPVLEEMFNQINTISSSDLPEKEKQVQIKAVQDAAQRKLTGGK